MEKLIRAADNANGAALRALSSPELVRLGDQCLEDHLLQLAITGHKRHKALQGNAFYAFLSDPEIVRYPVSLVYETGPLAAHQFGHAQPDPSSIVPAFRIYLHPRIEDRQDWIRLAVPFFIPSINYGDKATEDQALLFGATLHGMTSDQYYRALCEIADRIGAVPCLQGETHKLV